MVSRTIRGPSADEHSTPDYGFVGNVTHFYNLGVHKNSRNLQIFAIFAGIARAHNGAA